MKGAEEDQRFMHTGEQVIREVAAASPRALLSFSTGKDAIGAALAMRGHFDEVQPYFLYIVPGLEFIEESLAYYEAKLFGGKRIIRMPHPSLIRMLNGFVFQPPERCAVIERLDLGEHDYEDIRDSLIAHLGWPKSAMTATGVRAADSPIRYSHFKRRGAINWSKQTFAPIFDWKKDRLFDCIKRSGVKLPVDYRLFGRTFDGLDLRFLYPIKQHFPADYRRILEWFPLADAEVYRYEKRIQS